MFSRLFPRKTLFFDFFEQHAELIVKSSESLLKGILGERSYLLEVKALEHEADQVAKQCIEALYKTFITPIDRDLIFKLIGRQDDIIDSIDAVADCMIIYKIAQVSLDSDVYLLSKVLFDAVQQVQIAVKELRSLEPGEFASKACAEIYRLEHHADNVLRDALARLFEEESDPRQIIKLKDIFEYLELATDRCADVANVIEGILLELS